jgi:hypothetical protein
MAISSLVVTVSTLASGGVADLALPQLWRSALNQRTGDRGTAEAWHFFFDSKMNPLISIHLISIHGRLVSLLVVAE